MTWGLTSKTGYEWGFSGTSCRVYDSSILIPTEEIQDSPGNSSLLVKLQFWPICKLSGEVSPEKTATMGSAPKILKKYDMCKNIEYFINIE